MKLRIFPILNEDGTEMYPTWQMPRRAHANDVGADVFSTINVTINPHETVKIPLGFGIDVPAGYGASIYPRTGKSAAGIVTLLPPIDPGYTGNINAITQNTSDKPIEIKVGDAVGQLVVYPVAICDFVRDLGVERGTDAFGSTERNLAAKAAAEKCKE